MPKTRPSIRIVLPPELHERFKEVCPEHGDISTTIRFLIKGYILGIESLKAKGTTIIDLSRTATQQAGQELAESRKFKSDKKEGKWWKKLDHEKATPS